MNVVSLFSGVGGFDRGLELAGHRIVAQCEKDAYCRGILARHFPGVPCFEDVVRVGRLQSGGVGESSPPAHARTRQVADGVDLLCGGFPCQDLSVAGRRAGLAGDRSGLFFEFARVADAVLGDGGWVLIENVPGLLSSNGGRDFAVLLATLADIGFHDLAWRVLDSRYFGVPQRRRRVFIVGRRAAGDRARAVLLEPESGGGDFAPGREARTRVAASLSRGSASPGVSAPGRRQEDDENLVAGPLTKRYGKGINTTADDGAAVVAPLVSRSSRGRPQTLSAGHNTDSHLVAHTLRAEGFDASEDGTGRGTPLTVAGAIGGGNDGAGRRSEYDPNLVCPPADPDGVRAASGLPGRVDDPQAFNLRGRDEGARVEMSDVASVRASQGGSSRSYIHGAGEGDAHDPPPDGPRYSAMGNAVTVNVARWIGERLNGVAA